MRQSWPTPARPRRKHPLNKLGRVLLDTVIAQLAECLVLREIPDMDRPEVLKSWKGGFPKAHHLVLPGKSHAKLDEVGTKPSDVVDGFFPEFVIVSAHAEGAGRIQG